MAEDYRIEFWRKPYPPNPAMLRSILAREGYAVSQWCDQPETFYGVHKHIEDQSHWVISGSLELQILNGDIHVLSAGDRDFMPAHTYHSARVLGEEPVLYLVGIRRG
jgi:quercetin dioxygenase-like cupin family protein